mgnify:CR=1 FL=1
MIRVIFVGIAVSHIASSELTYQTSKGGTRACDGNCVNETVLHTAATDDGHKASSYTGTARRDDDTRIGIINKAVDDFSTADTMDNTTCLITLHGTH